MLSPRHPLAGSRSIRLHQLKDERFVITNSNYKMEYIVQKLCATAGFEPRILYEGTSTDMPMFFISTGQAVMITPHSITAGVQSAIPFNNGIISIPLVNEYPDMRKVIRAAFREGHYQTQTSQAFYDRIVEFFAAID